ncbi:6650_t:CDS:2, partial [Diversispora eburnea]
MFLTITTLTALTPVFIAPVLIATFEKYIKIKERRQQSKQSNENADQNFEDSNTSAVTRGVHDNNNSSTDGQPPTKPILTTETEPISKLTSSNYTEEERLK